jgi:hypothetical protein
MPVASGKLQPIISTGDGGGEDGEATEHGDTAGIETGSWERRQILDEFTRVTG